MTSPRAYSLQSLGAFTINLLPFISIGILPLLPQMRLYILLSPLLHSSFG